ncbi:MAG: restriction endonuclease subunit S, partial [Chitinophagales bacterium]|nr:restriction endonuclease subunit S [Chitinophagales bacterium]
MKNWEKIKLGDLCEVITKGTTPTSIGYNFTDSGIKFIKVESLTESGEIIPNKVAYIDEACHQALKRSQLKKNDILFSIAGALGRIGIVKEDILPANTNQALAIIRLKKDSNALVEFIAKYFNSNIVTDEIEKLRIGAAQQNLSLTQLNNLFVPLPPLPEQQRIVSILDEALAAIAKAKANAEQNLKNAKELFESYLQGVFENGKWEKKKLGEFCNIIGGGTPSKANAKFYDGNIYWATVRDMKGEVITDTEHKITEEAVKNSSTNIIPKGNVVIATRVGLGKVCLIANDTAINQDLRGVVPINSKKLSVDFLYHWFKSIANKIVEEGTGATVQGVKLPFIKSLSIPLPQLKEQQTIVRQLDALRAETQKLEAVYQKKIDDLEELKKSILQKAFAGELRSPEGAEYKSEVATPLADKKPNTITSP